MPEVKRETVVLKTWTFQTLAPSLHALRKSPWKRIVKAYVKFNVIGLLIFPISTLTFFLCTHLDWAAWFIANGVGSLFQFSLIYLLNKTKKGLMFEGRR